MECVDGKSRMRDHSLVSHHPAVKPCITETVSRCWLVSVSGPVPPAMTPAHSTRRCWSMVSTSRILSLFPKLWKLMMLTLINLMIQSFKVRNLQSKYEIMMTAVLLVLLFTVNYLELLIVLSETLESL